MVGYFSLANSNSQCCLANVSQALKQSTKAQKLQYESWRALLLRCLANVEAVIDFGEDEGIGEEVAEQVLPQVQQLRQILQQHLVNGISLRLNIVWLCGLPLNHTGHVKVTCSTSI